MNYKKIFIFIISFFIMLINVNATTYKVIVTGNAVSIRSGAGTNNSRITSVSSGAVYTTSDNSIYPSSEGCLVGWYKINYNGGYAYICSEYASIEEAEEHTDDIYYRPWTTPKMAITGGAKFISRTYIEKGQFTSYLKKFNVNPNGAYSVYNHQYMANLRAPYSEAYTSFKSYRDNGLLLLPLEFTIPIFDNMPDVTNLPGVDSEYICQSEVIDEVFEAALNEQGFPETYKCKLRLIHNTYPNWTFKAMNTGLDFDRSVKAEKAQSSIQGGDQYYDLSSGNKIETEKGWYVANNETVAFYLDPRNSLVPERILMFENLGFSENYTETVVSSILEGTFMDGYSLLDNEAYASIFVTAGRDASISAVYLASLARQESGSKGSRATSGDEFSYQGTTYKGLFNFFNIGANSSAESPILAGLVWASGGYDSVIVNNVVENNSDNTTLSENKVLSLLGATKKENVLVNFSLGTTISAIKALLPNYTVLIGDNNDGSVLKTGDEVSVSDGAITFTYNIAIKGDVDGDGEEQATDYVKIKNYIMERAGSELNLIQSYAADVDDNGEIGATDYVLIKNRIMGR